MSFTVAASLAVVVAGVVLTLVLQSLLGMLLIIGGVGALGAYAAPAALQRLGVFLSVGFGPRRRG